MQWYYILYYHHNYHCHNHYYPYVFFLLLQLDKDPDIRIDKYFVIGDIMPVEVSSFCFILNNIIVHNSHQIFFFFFFFSLFILNLLALQRYILCFHIRPIIKFIINNSVCCCSLFDIYYLNIVLFTNLLFNICRYYSVAIFG